MSAADEAEAVLHRRASLLLRGIERVNATISQWHEIEANDALPMDFRREVRRPELSLDQCEAVHQILVQELGRLEGAK